MVRAFFLSHLRWLLIKLLQDKYQIDTVYAVMLSLRSRYQAAVYALLNDRVANGIQCIFKVMIKFYSE